MTRGTRQMRMNKENETGQMRMQLKKWKTRKAWLPGLWSQVCVVLEKKPNNPLSWASLPQVSQMGATLLAPCRSSSSSRTRPWWSACPRSTDTFTQSLCFNHNIGEGMYLPSRVYPALVGNIQDLDLYRVVQSRVSHDQLLYLGPGGEQLVVRTEH